MNACTCMEERRNGGRVARGREERRTTEEVVEQRRRTLLREPVADELQDPAHGVHGAADLQPVGSVGQSRGGQEREGCLREVQDLPRVLIR